MLFEHCIPEMIYQVSDKEAISNDKKETFASKIIKTVGSPITFKNEFVAVDAVPWLMKVKRPFYNSKERSKSADP